MIALPSTTDSDTEEEIQALSLHLCESYEALTFLYDAIATLAQAWPTTKLWNRLAGVVGSETLAVRFASYDTRAVLPSRAAANRLVQVGPVQLEAVLVEELINLHHADTAEPLIANDAGQGLPVGVRQLIVVPMQHGTPVLGWIVAINHRSGIEFGTEEARLLQAIAHLVASRINVEQAALSCDRTS